MIFEVSLIDIVLDLLIAAVSYLLVPIIVIISGKKYCLKKLKKINVINCGVIWLLFRVIEAGLGNEPTSGLSVFLWGGIGYSLLKKNCLTEETSAYSPLSVNDASNDKVRMQKCSSRKHKKYCSYCGNLIDNDTKKCVWCGRQYFNGVRLKKLSMIVLSIFLVISLIGAFMLYRMNLDAQNEIERLSKELNNPANDANYRVAVYKQIEKLQEELQDFQISNRVR